MQKTALIILDGWGYRKETKGNAITPKTAPFFFSLLKKYPWTLLEASGEAVGLPKGTLGGSEVGHLTIGAGRVIKQDLVRINENISSGKFFRNKQLLNALNYAREHKKKVHIVGLVSDGGIHSHINHIIALTDACKRKKISDVFVHAVTDGRDSAPTSAGKYLTRLQKEMKTGSIATVIGRYYAMDRDNRWNREKKAFDLLTKGKGRNFSSYKDVLKYSYSRKETDEFVRPSVLNTQGIVKKGDLIIFANFRPDRMRQLTTLFSQERKYRLLSMTKYDEKSPIPAMYPLARIKNTVGEIISRRGLKQLRIAETEKYAHVTYFFNGMREESFPGETRILVPSPKVPTYDKKPEMSARKITKVFLKEFTKYDFIVVNFANADMVGHTGDFLATKKAVACVDECLDKIVSKCQKKAYQIVVTADHGNAEKKQRALKTTHTLNKVPFVVANKSRKLSRRVENMKKLADIKEACITQFS